MLLLREVLPQVLGLVQQDLLVLEGLHHDLVKVLEAVLEGLGSEWGLLRFRQTTVLFKVGDYVVGYAVADIFYFLGEITHGLLTFK